MGSRPNTNSSDYGIVVIAVVVIALCLLFDALPIHNGRHMAFNPLLQQSRAIGLAMFSYANDYDGKYPTGKSSTEVFQQLLDGGYITDPAIFYIPMQGKFRAVIGAKLRPENVCWDVTGGVTTRSPESLPVVFSTGYKVTYSAGADAVPVIKPFPVYIIPPRTFGQWWSGAPLPIRDPGIDVFYVSNSARFIPFSAATSSVPELVRPEFLPDGKTYIHLTPDGPIKP